MEIRSSDARIEKINSNLYQIVVDDRFHHINELVDEPKLLAMLGDSLVDEKTEPITAAEVLTDLDNQNVGYVLKVSLLKRVA